MQIDDIYIGNNILQADFFTQRISAKNIVIVTDNIVANLHLTSLLTQMQNFNTHVMELPNGEEHKTWEAVTQILQALVQHQHDRSDIVISFGGGIVGDVTGLAAALYMRGTKWLQIPTTLIAQVDAAIGGKTGCNYLGVKNLIGTFYQPDAVLIDIKFLTTLPDREFIAGMAEVIKYGFVCDAGFFCWLENHCAAIKARDSLILQQMVGRCCAIKQAIVALDPHDHAQRMILNFGHSFGHALEAATEFKKYLHGEAVAIGMLLATRLAVRIGLLEEHLLNRLVALLLSFDLKLDLDHEHCNIDKLIDYLRYDKKQRGGELNFVLPCALGKAKIVPVLTLDVLWTVENYQQVLEELLQNYV